MPDISSQSGDAGVAATAQSLASSTALRALLVDDEAPALSELAFLLRQDPRIGKIRTATSGAEALRALDTHQVDVVFCDIKMPGLDGMDFARILARYSERPQIVFVTAYDEHAVDAFEVRATDYVMKPVRGDRLTEAVRRVVAARTGDGSGAPTGPGPSEPPADETIPIELGGVTTFIQRSQVLYARAHGDYARLHTSTGSHLVRISLSTLEDRWGAMGFVRIHRSTLVSLPEVTEVRMDRGRCSVRLGEVDLQVSRRHTRDLRNRLSRSAIVNDP